VRASRDLIGLNQMFIELSKKLLRRSMEFERKIMSRVTGRFRSHRVITPHASMALDALRDRLEEASRRVAQSERIVDGWRDLIDGKQVEGGDATAARSLLEAFQASLEAAISDKKEAEEALARRLRDLFEGANGRAPKTDHELDEWLASPEGRAATAFEPTPLPRWMEIGRRS
jgi:hypothetical protein